MPKVSVIVPVYKVEEYLPRCVQSILTQTLGDFELLLIDDGSPDRCGELCDDYARQDGRVRVIHQKNQGLSGARNSGLAAATGDYVAFIDSDDAAAPEMLEAMVQAIEAQAADVCACNARLVEESDDGAVTEHLYLDDMYDGEMTFSRYDLTAFRWDLFGTRIPVTACFHMYSKALLDKLRLRFRPTKEILSEDVLFNLCCYAGVRKGVYLNRPLYIYYIRRGSLMQSKPAPDTLDRRVRMERELRAFLRRQHIRAPLCSSAYEIWWYLLYLGQKSTGAELRELLRQISPQNRPFFRRCMRSLIFGRAGKRHAAKNGLAGKTLLYQKCIWLLLGCGRYETPIRTNIAHKPDVS